MSKEYQHPLALTICVTQLTVWAMPDCPAQSLPTNIRAKFTKPVTLPVTRTMSIFKLQPLKTDIV